MRRLRELNLYRDIAGEMALHGVKGDDFGGCFAIKHNGVMLSCIASNAEGWDHISISTDLPRCPTWAEMEHVKRLFFRADETAMQLHVPPTDHISVHPFCLHLWRPHAAEIPLPPKEFV